MSASAGKKMRATLAVVGGSSVILIALKQLTVLVCFILMTKDITDNESAIC